MAKYIDKAALVAEIEKELNTTKKYSTEYVNGKKYALNKILSFIDTLEVKEINNVWHDTRRTIPEDGSEQIVCIKEDGLAVSTVGKIVNGTIIWAYLGDLLYTNSFNVEVKEVNEEPASDDLEEAADYYASMASQAYKGVYCEYCNDKVAFKAGAKWQKEQTIYKACNYLFSHMGLFVTFFDDDIVEDIERSEFIKKFRIAMEE